jgi:hypothetical protein
LWQTQLTKPKLAIWNLLKLTFNCDNMNMNVFCYSIFSFNFLTLDLGYFSSSFNLAKTLVCKHFTFQVCYLLVYSSEVTWVVIVCYKFVFPLLHITRILVGLNLIKLTKPACKVLIASSYKIMFKPYLFQCGTLNSPPTRPLPGMNIWSVYW